MDIQDRLDHIDKSLEEASNNVGSSIQDLAHLASELPFLPAPTLYRVLGEHKMALWADRDAIRYLGAALQRSHLQPELRITDSDFITGEAREPKTSIRDAMAELERAARLLTEAGEALEAAQSNISGQGYDLLSNPLA